MKKILSCVVILCSFFWSFTVSVYGVEVSDDTEACISCHEEVTPGIVADWKASLHAKVSVAGALDKQPLSRRISVSVVPSSLAKVTVGCAECHTQSPETHEDTFDHNGYKVHVVVTPKDCGLCHPLEVEEYSENLMANAYGNLMNNPLYHDLAEQIVGIQRYTGEKIESERGHETTYADSCLFCHGTEVKVLGFRERETTMGKMKFPVLSGWPNQGVGRINPDGSKGACTPCHTRHRFSIEEARKPAACSTCHKGPDVPAYKVYLVSKHGAIYSSLSRKWDFNAVPWVAGRDFSAPTCAACHMSLLATEEGDVVVERTHRMNDRLPWRLFGLIYAHAHPKSPDTTIIKNAAGLPLPTELNGEVVERYLIGKNEMRRRRREMEKVCSQCHSYEWVEGHFTKLERTVKETNEMTLAATKILLSAWREGVASGLSEGDSIFNEPIEKMWVVQWLFYANSTRFASAMAGADYGVFANGRWYMSENLRKMKELLDMKRK